MWHKSFVQRYEKRKGWSRRRAGLSAVRCSLTQPTMPRQPPQSAPTQVRQRRARRSAPGSGDSALVGLQACRSCAARTGPLYWPGSPHATQGWIQGLWGSLCLVSRSHDGETKLHSAVRSPRQCKIEAEIEEFFPQQFERGTVRVCNHIRTVSPTPSTWR